MNGPGLPPLCEYHAWQLWSFLRGYLACEPGETVTASADVLARVIGEMSGPCASVVDGPGVYSLGPDECVKSGAAAGLGWRP